MLLNNMSQQDSVFLGLKTTTNNFMHNQQKALGISSVSFNLFYIFIKSI